MSKEEYFKVKINKDTRHNLVENFFDEMLQEVLYNIVDNNGNVRFLYLCDTDEFYNEDMENNGIKKQKISTERFSIPLSKCYYKVLYDLIKAVVDSIIKRGMFGRTNNPVVVCGGCTVNGTNLDIELGIDLQEK